MEHTVSYSDLKRLVENSQDLILIDVRTGSEVARQRIPRAIHIPLDEVEAALQMTPEGFKAKYGIQKPAADAPELVFHCQSGKRGIVAMNKAHRLGYLTTRNFPGGCNEWFARERK
ncbi:thiosulfate sulfurtransferase/rhodanese-like domain-containing protein 1 [Austrofundulus limnaeus]|uniref:Thiosulfate sulfurtransferase/rhodanese-like domain-containing protein 1 n=1 Tax=Austrofundulus limnaeus TaxID=52670 RepID=A0A2I4B210_AUSLI|nr:PREDICTED: thiosulfate sulfurtransferase/rhodanese-like domain-containing protein 1 [Austrofundulus limnaeus]